jgi:hypothetical protein
VKQELVTMRKHPLVSYFALAYAFSWSIHVPLALSAHGLLAVTLPPGLHFAGAYGPALAALVVTGITLGVFGLRDSLSQMLDWRVRIAWLLVAAFSPAVLFLVSVVIIRLWDGVCPISVSLDTCRNSPPWVGSPAGSSGP